MTRVFSFLISIAPAYGVVSEVGEEIQSIWQVVTTEVTGALK